MKTPRVGFGTIAGLASLAFRPALPVCAQRDELP